MTNDPLTIRPASGRQDVEEIGRLFLEYAQSLNFSLCFQGFDEELAALPGCYAEPRGRLLLAQAGDRIAGGVGLRPLADHICEMKRLYVRPGFRGLKAGRHLAEAIIATGKEIGYRRMRLDTTDAMTAAHALYRQLGFVEIPPITITRTRAFTISSSVSTDNEPSFHGKLPPLTSRRQI